MPTANYYPVFEPDQVLTDEHLNAMFAYLDRQDHLTRNKLLGIGIACGLHTSPGGSSIRISGGVGITSLGYLLQFDADEFTHFRSYSVPDFPDTISPAVHAWYVNLGMLQLIPASQPKEPTDKSLADNASIFKSHVVLLFLEPNLTDLKNCTTQDCNDKGKRVDLPVRAMLVSREKLTGFKYFNFQQQRFNFPSVHLSRWNVPAKTLDQPGRVIEAFDAVLSARLFKEMSDACSFVHDVFKPLFGDGNSDTALLQVYTHLAQIQQQLRSASIVNYQYLYDYVDDLIKAYNDFRELVFDVLTECCPDENLFPLHLALGEAGIDSAVTQSPFRNQFIYSPLFGQHKGLMQQAKHAYRRLVMMLEQFQIPTSSALSIRANGLPIEVTPSVLGDYPLGRRCIPFYYKPVPLNEYWDFEKSRKGRAAFNYGYFSEAYSDDEMVKQPLLYDTEPHNFFRIEGHTGKPVQTALRDLVGKKNQFNLPVDIVAVNVYPNTELAEEDKLRCYFSDLETHYNVVLAEMLCKLHGVVCPAGKLPFNAKVFETVFGGRTTIAGFAKTNLEAKEFLFSDVNENLRSEATDSNAGEADLKSGFERFNLTKSFQPLFEATLQMLQVASKSFIDAQRGKLPYIKGTFLQSFCLPDVKAQTVASYYINWAKANPGKRWPKPQALAAGEPDFTKWTITGYFHLFYLIDTTEELIAKIIPYDLGDLDYRLFKSAYEEAMEAVEGYADYYDNFYHAMDIGRDIQDVNANKPFNLIQEELEDWIVDKIVTRLYADTRAVMLMCADDRIEQLLFEYRKRIKEVLEQLTLANYAKHKTGLEHKAGVPKGGTFVMLYYNVPKRTGSILPARESFFNEANLREVVSEMNISADTSKKTPELNKEEVVKGIDTIEKMVSMNKNEFAAGQILDLEKILGRIRDLQVSPNTMRIPEGVVFADLYIPYMCCSQCAPTAFVFVEKPDEEPVPVIALDKTNFCNDESARIAIKAEPAGGTLTGQGVESDNGKFFFNPQGLAEGSYTLNYKLGSKSAVITVTVKATLDPNFNFVIKGEDPTGGGIVVAFTSVASAGNHEWDFGDNTAKSTAANPEHTYFLQGNTATFKVVHGVSNGNCAMEPVVKEVKIQRNVDITLTIKKSKLCSNDVPERIGYKPDGGVMVCKENPAAITSINNIFHFAPALAGQGIFTIVYTVAGVSKELQLEVLPAPSADFSSKITDTNQRQIFVQFTPAFTGGKHRWEFSDGQTSDQPAPLMGFSLAAGAAGEISANHTLVAEPCTVVVKKVVSLSLPVDVSNSTMNLCYEPKLAVAMEPNLTAPASVTVVDAGIHKMNTKGQLLLSDKTPLGASSTLVVYRVNTGAATLEKRVTVNVNRLDDRIQVRFFPREAITLQAANRSVLWKISADNNGQVAVITENRRENPLTLKFMTEAPRGVSTGFIIEAVISGGLCRQNIRHVISADDYKRLTSGGGELNL